MPFMVKGPCSSNLPPPSAFTVCAVNAGVGLPLAVEPLGLGISSASTSAAPMLALAQVNAHGHLGGLGLLRVEAETGQAEDS